jgi:hypothetical protein
MSNTHQYTMDGNYFDPKNSSFPGHTHCVPNNFMCYWVMVMDMVVVVVVVVVVSVCLCLSCFAGRVPKTSELR